MANRVAERAGLSDAAAPRWRGPLLAAASYLAVQLLALTTTTYAHLHYDEGMTPATAHALAWGRWSDVWSLIDLPHCGGCVVYATAAWGVFAVLPDVVLTWKLVPLALSAVAAACLFRVVADLVGERWGALAVWLLAAPPGELAQAEVVSWGNHLEAGLLCWIVLAALPREAPSPRRALLAGAVAGLSVAFVPTALIAPAAVLPWLLLRRGAREAGAFASGLVTLPLFRLVQGALGPAWVGLLAVPPVSATSTIDPVRQLRLLSSVSQLGPVFGGLRETFWPWDGALFAATAVGALALVVVRGRGRAELVAAVPLVWLAVYTLAPWRLGTIGSLGGERLVLFRYVLPLLGLLPGVLAVAAGLLSAAGARRAALVLALGAALPGTVERVWILGTEAGSSLPWLTSQTSSAWVWFRRTPLRDNQDIAARWRCGPDAPACAFTQAVAGGRAAYAGAAPQAGCDLRAHPAPGADAELAWLTGYLDAWALACFTADDDVPRLLAAAEAWRARGPTDPALARHVAAATAAAWADRIYGEVFTWPGLDWAQLDLHPHGEALAWARGLRDGRELGRVTAPPTDLPAPYRPWWALGFGQLAGTRRPGTLAPWLGAVDCATRAGLDVGLADAHARPWWGVPSADLVDRVRAGVAACAAP